MMNEWPGCSNRTLFTKPGGGTDVSHGRSGQAPTLDMMPASQDPSLAGDL